ncbi:MULTISPECIES: sporulation integral membrane protein YtvI [Clostridia]|uniref:sporulation integral membrane protein YtvI n=1 Tax=Clostridia TaxID=186801 RepID=UPI000EA08005|nr:MULTISPECIES: sporulation integral membrane protein YtvI [Clostridia]NBJ68990.1 sporulation integral membrane protein YtvI [Roseburia sp. 1XD42-34]RKI79891.1 sporulation integral membrane protein YtvI [Clostridium sp. 1xD42-85]
MYKPILSQVLRFASIVACVILGYVLLTASFAYLYPVVIASILAAGIHPIASFMEEKMKFPRMMAVIGTMLFLFATISSILFILFSEFMQGTLFLAAQLPDYIQTFSHYVTNIMEQKIIPMYEKITSYLQALNPSQQEAVSKSIKQFTLKVSTTLSESLQTFLLRIPAVFTTLPNSFTVMIFILLATFLIAIDYKKLTAFGKELIPQFFQTKIKNIQKQLKKTIAAYIKAQFILVLISAFLVYIGLKILQINHAFTISLYVALVDLIPYIGSGVIFFPWMIYLFIVGDYSLTIQLAFLYGFIIIIRQLIEPKILSSSMGIHPLIALLTLFIGLQLWGVIGFIVAPVILISINAFYQAGTFHDIWKFIKG